MKVALVHDDLVQWGGAERVLVAISEIFPNAPIYTSVVDDKNEILKQNFGSKKIITSFLQQIPGWRTLYKALLPLYPIAFEQFNFDEYDLVISQTTRFAKAIITKPHTRHICYCHTPARFLWNFSGQEVPKLLKPYLSFLRMYDRLSSSRVDFWIAGSRNAQQRIKKVYQKDSHIIYPFVEIERFSNIKPFDGGYLLIISRLNKYKKVDLVIRTIAKLGKPLKVVGLGPEHGNLQKLAFKVSDNGSMVEFLGQIKEDLLINLIAGCGALIVAGEEDFGLTPLEAQALGKPIVAYKSGGALETVIEGETGYFFDAQNIESLSRALQKLDKRGYNQKRCFAQASLFSKEKFKENFQDMINKL